MTDLSKTHAKCGVAIDVAINVMHARKTCTDKCRISRTPPVSSHFPHTLDLNHQCAHLSRGKILQSTAVDKCSPKYVLLNTKVLINLFICTHEKHVMKFMMPSTHTTCRDERERRFQNGGLFKLGLFVRSQKPSGTPAEPTFDSFCGVDFLVAKRVWKSLRRKIGLNAVGALSMSRGLNQALSSPRSIHLTACSCRSKFACAVSASYFFLVRTPVFLRAQPKTAQIFPVCTA